MIAQTPFAFQDYENPTGEHPPPVPSLLNQGKTKNRRIMKYYSPTPADQIDPLIFAPVDHPPPHSVCDVLSARTQYQQDVKPMDISNLFMTRPLIERITTNTNRPEIYGKRARWRQGVGRAIGGRVACLVGHCGLHEGVLLTSSEGP